MGDIIELLENIKTKSAIPANSESSNLRNYLTSKGYLEDRQEKPHLSEKGERYLSALYLLKAEQLPNNFFSQERGRKILAQLERSSYIEWENTHTLKPTFTVTEKGRELLDFLKEETTR